jgi:D-threo-aldose 1-dehydrogenase
MKAACDRRGVPLAAAGLQFSMRAPFIDSTVVGVSAPERVAQTVAYAEQEIPADLWDELDSLAPPTDVWLG